jgi:hypothetical protein
LEKADSLEQTEQGALAALSARLRLAELSIALGASFEDRRYDASTQRHDRRVTADASLHYDLGSSLALVAGYAFTRNRSKNPYDYVRHLGHGGVEASW